MKGFSIEPDYSFKLGAEQIDGFVRPLSQYGIKFQLIEPIDPRTKYLYYQPCRYNHSAMSDYDYLE